MKPLVLALAATLVALSSGVESQQRGIDALGEKLRGSPDVAIRRKAAQALGRASTARSVGILRTARGSERNSAVRLEIMRALRTIAFQRYPGYREALAAIGEAADDDSERDELVRLRATEALWEAGKKDLLDPVPILHRQLSDRSQRLRLAAVKMLRKHGSAQAADALGRAALDKNQSETIRLEAIAGIGAVALTEGVEMGRHVEANNIAVMRLLGAPPLVPVAALEKRHERQVKFLAAIARDPDNSFTLMLRSVKSLGNVKDRSAIPVLRELIETHPHAGIRKQATRVLSYVLARQYE